MLLANYLSCVEAIAACAVVLIDAVEYFDNGVLSGSVASVSSANLILLRLVYEAICESRQIDARAFNSADEYFHAICSIVNDDKINNIRGMYENQV